MSDTPPHDDDNEVPGGRFRRLGRRLLREGEAAGKFSARDVLGAVLEGSDKAKTEVVRVVAREVRAYLEELGLREVLTDYSLEVHASINLRRLSELEKLPRSEVADRRVEPRRGDPRGESPRAEPGRGESSRSDEDTPGDE